MTFYGASRSTIWDVRGRKPSLWRRLSAPQLFVGSFLGLVVLGTLGLLTLPGLYTGPGLGFVDAVGTGSLPPVVVSIGPVTSDRARAMRAPIRVSIEWGA